MPAKSEKQKKFMDAAAHNPAFAKKVGVPVKVAKEYSQASKGQTFNEGGAMKHSDMSMDKKVVKKAVGMHDKQQHGGKKTDMSKLKKGGMPMVMKDGKKVPAFAAKSGGMTKMARGGGVETKGKTKGTMIKMKSGGKTC
jgi:hypothetical protein